MSSSPTTTTTPDPAPLDMDAQTRLGKLYHMVLREVEDESALTEIDSGLYREMSEFIGNLSRQEYAGVEDEVKAQAIAVSSGLVSMLLRTRLEKASKLRAASGAEEDSYVMQRLLDEEKYILDSEEERDERREIILSATKSGRSKLLESISERHKADRIVVRFLKDVEQMVGADMSMYGPFRAEDIATIPHENAQALISGRSAARVRWED